ncbi:MAG: phosphotransferase [Deltaproteobacteria bacterium]|nr:phosphotransferase [Deltaproteobacteria bacterium]
MERVERMLAGPGRRNELALVEAGGSRFVLKARRDADDDAQREAWALRLRRGASAPLLHVHLTRTEVVSLGVRRGMALDVGLGGVIVMDFVEGADPDDRDRAKSAAAAVAELHSTRARRGPDFGCPSSAHLIYGYAADLAKRIVRQQMLVERDRVRLTRVMEIAARRVERLGLGPRARRSLCHGDLRWHNMKMLDGCVRLVDFEGAGLGDPAVDLALMTCRTPLEEREEVELVDAYLSARRDDSFLDRYVRVLPLVSLVSALSAVVVGRTGTRARYRDELDRAFRRFDTRPATGARARAR